MNQATEIAATEAARRIGCDLNRIYQHLWVGRLEARKVDGRWLVSEKSVQDYLTNREARKSQ
jgi:hypothetical protein